MKPNKGILFLGMSAELLGLILGAAYLGDLIDKHYQWKGLATAGLIVLSLFSWLTRLVFLIKKMNNEDSSSE